MFSRHLLFLLRQLAKRPGLTIAIVLITAAGIAVNAAVFSVVYAVLLKPLPYPEAQQLLFISGTSGTGERMPVSLPDFRDWRTQQHTFEDLAAYNVEDFSLLLNGETQHYAGAFVSARYFRTLGLLPKIGRWFLDNEDQSGSSLITDRTAVFAAFGCTIVDALAIVSHNCLITAVTTEIETDVMAAIHQFTDSFVRITGFKIDPAPVRHIAAGGF